MDSVVGNIRAPDFPSELDWVNVDSPPSLRRLRGKIVLIDFWTSCCINCHHVLPTLRRLEQEFREILVVVGVHSAKFEAERSTESLRQAVLRFGIEHPVVNDAELEIWRSYTVRAWPTTVLVDPEGRIRAQKRGELGFAGAAERIEAMCNHFDKRGLVDRAPFLGAPERRREPDRRLRFPAGLLVDGDRIFVADTGHHRVLELKLREPAKTDSSTVEQADLVRSFGDGQIGFDDGHGERARFHHPHGLALCGDRLYIADTDNHAVRRIELESGVVSTVAGTGEIEPRPRVGASPSPTPVSGILEPASETPLRSPWGLCTEGPGRLIVAMAGSHQLWRLHLSDWAGADGAGADGAGADGAGPAALELLAGNGRESLIDGIGTAASFDQPSGLTARAAVDGEPMVLFVADAEASAVRRVEIASPTGPATGAGGEDAGGEDAGGDSEGARVETVVGVGLFDFGDRDGVGDEVRLQHPTDLAWLDGSLYLADSYNHKIRHLDPGTSRTLTLAGDATAGARDGDGSSARFFEPEGIAADPARQRLLVADTNNHRIRIIELAGGQGKARVSTLEITDRGR